MLRALPFFHAIDFTINKVGIKSWWMEPAAALQDKGFANTMTGRSNNRKRLL